MFFDGEWDKLRWWEFGPFVFWYVIAFSVRDLVKHRGSVLTASLAFSTALAVVPLLSVALWALLTFGGSADGASLEPYVQQLFPAAASGIVAYLTQFASTSANEVAGLGAVTFYAIAFFLFVSVERAFNIIWNSHRKRPIAQKIGAFLLIMSIGPLALSLSFALSTYAAIRLEQFHDDPHFLLRLAPFLLAFGAFTAMNHWLPTTRVQALASALAGAFTAVAFELAKYGFNVYVTELVLVPYNQVYGALGLFPLFLIWLYVIWIIVLFGAELAYTSQNLATLVRVARASEIGPGRAGEHVFRPTIGLELYAPIARGFKSGKGRLTDRELVALTGYPEPVVRSAIEELARTGSLEIVEEDEGDRRLLPAKQLEDIDLWPMLEAFFNFEPTSRSKTIDQLLSRYEDVSREVLEGESALAFVPETSGSRRSARRSSNPKTRPEPGRRSPTPAPRQRSEPSRPDPDPIVPLADAEPLVDADVFESPPVDLSLDAQGPTLDAKPIERARDIAKRARQLSPDSQVEDSQPRERTRAAPGPMALRTSPGQSDEIPAEMSDDGIRIHTQDILIEEFDAEPEQPSAADLLKAALNKKGRKKKKKKRKEPSIEIDIAGMWDDFDVNNYEDALAKASSELRETSELDAEEVQLGDERSVPPPMPNKE
jgi:membrane protein